MQIRGRNFFDPGSWIRDPGWKIGSAGIKTMRFPHIPVPIFLTWKWTKDIRYQQFCGVGSAMILVNWILIRIGVGKNDPQKKASKEMCIFEEQNVLF
jgi:hypothetical protein